MIPPEYVLKYLSESQLKIDASNVRRIALAAGEAFGVQSVIIGQITEYNAFYPPVLGLSIEIIDVAKGATVASKAETYDSNMNYVHEELREYASKTRAHKSLFNDDLILHRFDMYIRFVCHRFIQKYL